jgi:hypothetical protein
MEAKVEAEIKTFEKLDDWLQQMKAWRKEKTACQEETDAPLEKEKVNREKIKAGL